jgi:RNA polymerase sigma-70 factor (ECF subfamily)
MEEKLAEPGRDEVTRQLMRHHAALFAYVLSLVRDFSRAEEVLQEVAVVVCRQWRDFRPGTHFMAWALRIARNKVFSLARAARREIPLSPEALAALERASEDHAPAGWTDAVRDCLERLGEGMRTVLALRYRDGLSGRQIADRLGRTVPAIHMALSRARAALAECVRRTAAEEGDVP